MPVMFAPLNHSAANFEILKGRHALKQQVFASGIWWIGLVKYRCMDS